MGNGVREAGDFVSEMGVIWENILLIWNVSFADFFC